MTWAEAAARLHVDPPTVSWIFIPFAACLATCWFCWRRGDRTDRVVAVTFSLCWFGSLVSIWTSALVLNDVRPPLFWRVIWDAVMALVFTASSMRRRKVWYGFAAMVQGVQMAVSTVDVSLHEPAGPLSWTFFYVTQSLNFVMMGAMIGQVLGARRAAGGPALR